ncbi:uncharacterized protein BDCG_17424 [Blastomyces dermatitidis ER-3]|uniref:Uncharacterized protein n=1 Tax=Ajellomyces dermatitidis (strain ER-3 / ATCC MYA-2586) TaxID=559297 RepID=A0ABX2VYG3_AJEDR|nr:uncharacterized protein BDCG_17424 [Blastomyces dermatitidis ER-3]OAT02172.1 hypothetical protein BDCG_17424 [Blastomyces dermatitidis ER-3]
MLFIIAGADILLHEVTTFVDRLKNEVVMLNSQRGNNSADTPSGNYEVEGIVFDKMLHGWLDSLNASYDFIRRYSHGK